MSRPFNLHGSKRRSRDFRDGRMVEAMAMGAMSVDGVGIEYRDDASRTPIASCIRVEEHLLSPFNSISKRPRHPCTAKKIAL